MYDYLDLRQTKRLKELVPYEVLAPDADEIIEELDRLNNIINEAKEECKSVIGNPEHTIVSKNELMKLMLNTLNKGDSNGNNKRTI